MPIFTRSNSGVTIIGHRGAAGHRPENTLESFACALEMGAHALELDVQLSADGHPVVFHDPSLDRTTDASGPVAARSLASLRDVDAGFRFTSGSDDFPFRGKGITISTLAEVLDAFPDIPLIVEIKADAGPPLAHATARVIADSGASDRVIVGSFDTGLLRVVRRRAPRVLTNFGNSEVRNLFLLHHVGLHRLSSLAGDVLMLPRRYNRHELATPRFRKASRDLGLEMHIWTVNEPAEMVEMIALGVDGILTDFPDRLVAILDPMSEE